VLRQKLMSEIAENASYANERHLAEVELRILLVSDALNLDEGGVGAGVALAALVAEDAAL
jgi:hypothetical protein